MGGLDMPSTAGAPAALPGGGRTIRHHAPRRRGRAATGWGESVRWKDEAAHLLSSVRRTPKGVVCAPHTCLLCSGHVFVVFTLSPIRVTRKMNLLSRLRPS